MDHLDDLEQMREMLDRRFDDLAGSEVTAMDGEEAYQQLVKNTESDRRRRQQIDAMIASAESSLERGEGVDGEDFFAELEREERRLRGQERPHSTRP